MNRIFFRPIIKFLIYRFTISILVTGDVGLYAGDVGLYAGDVGEYAGEPGIHGTYPGDVGE